MLSGISGERMKTETSLSECDCNWLPPQRMRLTCRSKSSVSRLITHCFLFIFLTPGMTNLRLFSRHMTILIGRQIINWIIKNRNLKFIHYLKWTSSEYMTVLHTDGISNMIYGFWEKWRSWEKKRRFKIFGCSKLNSIRRPCSCWLSPSPFLGAQLLLLWSPPSSSRLVPLNLNKSL